jgi:hypothetical protein
MTLATEEHTLKIALAMLALIAVQPAFAQDIDVTAMKCTSVTAANGDTKTEMKFLISGDKSTENAAGKLTIDVRPFVVGGASRNSLHATFVGVDGQTVSMRLSSSAGSDVLTQSLNCETQADIGRVGLMVRMDTSK